MEVVIWALAMVAFVIAEAVTVQLVSIWFAIGAFISMLVAYFTEISLVGQLGIFILSSAVMIIFTFPFLRKKRNSAHVGTNSELDVGKNATVIEEINNSEGKGRVKLNGVDWSAVSADDNGVIAVGTVVTVVQVKGAKLYVTINK